LVTLRILAGFLPVEVEHCPKTAQFLQNSGSCIFSDLLKLLNNRHVEEKVLLRCLDDGSSVVSNDK
jgi:hypothetical protein